MGNGLAKLQQGDESCVGGKPARIYGIQYSPSRDSLGRWLWALEHTPSCGTPGVFIIHGLCSVEFFLPKHEKADSYQAVRAAWPPPALPCAVAQRKQQEKKKDLTAAVLPIALAVDKPESVHTRGRQPAHRLLGSCLHLIKAISLV